MGSPAFGLLPGNNAAPPPTFAGNNPTGGLFNMGGNGGGPNNNFPNFPLFGSPNFGSAPSPMANAPVFGMGGMQGLNSGFNSGFPGNDLREFQRAYGKGTGSLLDNIFSKGLFNPQVAAAFLNAMQPGIQRGQADLLNSFGAEGSRFGSAAALGQGDYLSQVNLNEQSTLANMFMQAQQEQLGLLENTLPTLHQEQADSGGNWFTHMLQMGSGVALDLLGAHGTGTALFDKGAGIPSNANSAGGGISPMFQNLGQGSFNIGGSGSPVSDSTFWDTYSQDQLTASAGDALFAA